MKLKPVLFLVQFVPWMRSLPVVLAMGSMAASALAQSPAAPSAIVQLVKCGVVDVGGHLLEGGPVGRFVTTQFSKD